MKTIATLCCLLLTFGLWGQVAADFEAAELGLSTALAESDKKKGAEYLQKCIKLSEKSDSLRFLALEHTIIYYAVWSEKQAENTASMQLLDLAERIGGRKTAYYARALALRAKYLETMSQIEASGQLLEEAVAIYEALELQKEQHFIETQYYLAQSYHLQARFGQAERLYHAVLQAIHASAGDSSLHYLETLADLADLYKTVGHYEKSVQLYTEACNGLAQFHAENLFVIYSIYNDFAMVYMTSERYTEAQKLLLPANAFYDKYFGRGNDNSIKLATNLAYTYFKLGDLDKAESILRQNIALAQQYLGKNHDAHTTAIFDLAVLLQTRGKYPLAYQLLQSNFENMAAIYAPTHAVYLQWLNVMADLCIASDNLTEAQKYLDQAIRQNDGTDKIEALSSLWYLQKLLYKNYQEATTWAVKPLLAAHAEATFGQAAATLRDYRQTLFSDNDKFVALKLSTKWALSALDWAVMTQQKANIYMAFRWVEENKASVLSDKIAIARADKSAFAANNSHYMIGTELSNLYKILAQLRREYESSDDNAKKQALTKAINDAELNIRQLSQQLTQPQSANFDFSQADIAAIQSHLQAQELLLSYFVSDERSFVFGIERDRVQLYVLPIHKSDLRNLVADFYELISTSELMYNEPQEAYRQFSTTAHELYRQILAPVLQSTPAKKHLIIVGDDALLQIPFAPLLTDSVGESKEINYADLPYLLHQSAIEYHYSATLWARNTSKNQQYLHILGMAAQYQKQWANLPAAEREIQALETNYIGNYCKDTPQKKTFFEQNAHKYGVLHLAMHGYINRKMPSRSALIFSDSQRMEAWEIANLRLNSQLVVLSACESGAGKYQEGEGVMSLARVFLEAGAQALVVSLWQINDQIASDFMPNFYAQLAKGYNKSEALRQTQLQHLRRYKGKIAAPAYWAAFVHIGAVEPINIARVGNKYVFWASLLGAFGLLGALCYIRNKSNN
jgi:CHAT domain-containing protein